MRWDVLRHMAQAIITSGSPSLSLAPPKLPSVNRPRFPKFSTVTEFSTTHFIQLWSSKWDSHTIGIIWGFGGSADSQAPRTCGGGPAIIVVTPLQGSVGVPYGQRTRPLEDHLGSWKDTGV